MGTFYLRHIAAMLLRVSQEKMKHQIWLNFRKTGLLVTGLLSIVVLMAIPGYALATTITRTLPEFGGPRNPGGYPRTLDIGTFPTYTIPAGEHILSAEFISNWGNPGFAGTAASDLLVDGVIVATCTTTESCNTTPQPAGSIHFFFPSSDFSLLELGAVVTAIQHEDVSTQIGPETLILTTAVPEPRTLALLGMSLTLLVLIRRRNAASSHLTVT